MGREWITAEGGLSSSTTILSTLRSREFSGRPRFQRIPRPVIQERALVFSLMGPAGVRSLFKDSRTQVSYALSVWRTHVPRSSALAPSAFSLSFAKMNVNRQALGELINRWGVQWGLAPLKMSSAAEIISWLILTLAYGDAVMYTLTEMFDDEDFYVQPAVARGMLISLMKEIIFPPSLYQALQGRPGTTGGLWNFTLREKRTAWRNLVGDVAPMLVPTRTHEYLVAGLRRAINEATHHQRNIYHESRIERNVEGFFLGDMDNSDYDSD